MDWQDCKDQRLVKEANVDINLINSLIKSSEMKLESNSRLELDEVTATTKISIAYDTLRELLEALAVKRGFKIYNHDCFCAFLYEICGNKELSEDFDGFRKIRNQINYYGKNVSVEEARVLVKEMNELRMKIKKLF